MSFSNEFNCGHKFKHVSKCEQQLEYERQLNLRKQAKLNREASQYYDSCRTEEHKGKKKFGIRSYLTLSQRTQLEEIALRRKQHLLKAKDRELKLQMEIKQKKASAQKNGNEICICGHEMKLITIKDALVLSRLSLKAKAAIKSIPCDDCCKSMTDAETFWWCIPFADAHPISCKECKIKRNEMELKMEDGADKGKSKPKKNKKTKKKSSIAKKKKTAPVALDTFLQNNGCFDEDLHCILKRHGVTNDVQIMCIGSNLVWNAIVREFRALRRQKTGSVTKSSADNKIVAAFERIWREKTGIRSGGQKKKKTKKKVQKPQSKKDTEKKMELKVGNDAQSTQEKETQNRHQNDAAAPVSDGASMQNDNGNESRDATDEQSMANEKQNEQDNANGTQNENTLSAAKQSQNNDNEANDVTAINENQFYKFLKRIKLQKYANVFQANDCFDIQMIPFFEDDFLVSIGIANRMVRKRFLAAANAMQREMSEFKKAVPKRLRYILTDMLIVLVSTLACHSRRSCLNL